MRTTGLAVATCGALIAVFCGVVAAVSRDPATAGGTAAEHLRSGSDLSVPIAFGVLALLVGGGMYLLGGRSYVSTTDPAVRN